jgi:hypothetical protein
MTFQEKLTWGSFGITLVVYGFYFTTVLNAAGDTPIDDIDYQGLLIGAILVWVVLYIVQAIIVSLSNPKEADMTDERDRAVIRRARSVAFTVLSSLALVPLALAMIEAQQFWIAQTMLGALVIAQLAEGATQIFFYRRAV